MAARSQPPTRGAAQEHLSRQTPMNGLYALAAVLMRAPVTEAYSAQLDYSPNKLSGLPSSLLATRAARTSQGASTGQRPLLQGAGRVQQLESRRAGRLHAAECALPTKPLVTERWLGDSVSRKSLPPINGNKRRSPIRARAVQVPPGWLGRCSVRRRRQGEGAMPVGFDKWKRSAAITPVPAFANAQTAGSGSV
jgi:hypothetical protein